MYIYKITNKINGKCYIGQTSRKVKYRIQDHFSSRKSQTRISLINQAVHKYGKDNFIVEELCYCFTPEELDLKEIFFIKEFNSIAPNGYNLEFGGNKLKVLSEETKQKIKNTRKRISVVRKDIFTGEEKIYSSILEASKEGFNQHSIKNCCHGKHKLHKNNYWKFLDNIFSENAPKKVKCSAVPVIKTNPITKEQKEYLSIIEASREGFDRKSIKLCCDGKQEFHKNYLWKYKEV